MTDKIFVKKLRQDAKMPVRSNPSDAGADIFYCGDDVVTLFAGDSKLFPSGLRVAVPQGYVCEVKNRSGIASKKSLLVGACIVDSGYEGELFVNLHNVGRASQAVMPGDKIAQLLFYPIETPEFEELPEKEDLYSRTQKTSSRGASGFGSTGS